MGTVVRRASTLVTPRSSSSDRDDAASTNSSIKGINTTPAIVSPPTPEPQVTVPSPIAESPAREAASSQGDPASASAPVPSPLAQDPVIAAPLAVSTPESEVAPTSPQGYVPPPLLDSSAVGPGGFTDEVDELPQPQVIRDPSFIQPEPTEAERYQPILVTEASSGDMVDSPVEETFAERLEATASVPVVPEPQVETTADELTDAPAEVAVTERAVAVSDIQEVVPTQPTTPAEPVGEAASYFNLPAQEEPIPAPPVVEERTEAFETAVEAITLVGGVSASIPQEQTRDLDHAGGIITPPHRMTPPPQQSARAASIYPIPVYDVHEVWGGASRVDAEEQKSTIPSMNGDASLGSRASSIRLPDDPFADPVAPRITVSRHPELPNPYDTPQQGSDRGVSQDIPGVVVVPLPAFNEVVPSRSLHNFPSTESVNPGQPNMETDETRPLLSKPGSLRNNYLQPSAAAGSAVDVSVSPQSAALASSVWPAQSSGSGPRLHDLGWIEYQLPDGTLYYVHPTRRVTTDVDLRVDTVLDIVTAYLERQKDGNVPQGLEMWVREGQPQKSRSRRGSLVPVRCWVDHRKRVVQFDRANEANGNAKGKNVETDDHLDMEYRYWAFIEAHPAHTSLPVNSKIEAMDVLTWAWTDRLLPSQRTIPAPFTQEECQELMSLLRSFNNEQSDAGLQGVVQTRIISRILLRVAHWRQLNFRPNKPLPKDVTNNDLRFPKHRKTLTRALFDLVLSCVCLGIPYIFLDRHQSHRLDEESGLRSSAPMFVIGACTCLIAAILLSASVTFLSLPGLDNIARVAGFIAILFSSFSMASTVVAIFKYKADLERPAAHVGGEGLVMLSRRNIIMSLPLTFLLYAIVGFVTGIVLYSFRGVTVSDPLGPDRPFEDYTKWTVVGVLGGLAGMLTTSLFLLRR